jgi:outer membrane autotransporter protein
MPAYPAPPSQFDVWTEIHGSHSTSGDADSSFWIGYVGAHWFVSEDMIIGGLVQFDWAEEEYDSSDSSADGFGWMVGPYIAGRMPGTSLSYEGRVAWGQAENSISPSGTYKDDYDSERWFASGKIEGSYQFNSVTVSPSVRISYFEETLEAYTDSLSNEIPEQTVSLGEVRFGPSFSKTMQLENGSTFTPTVGIAGVWNFDIKENAASQPYPLGDDDLRARVNAGFSLTNTMGWVFSASGYYDGLGIDDYDAFGGKVRVTIPVH